MMTNNFNPDWSSPPSDTVKDILEEQGENYDDFIGNLAYETGYTIAGLEAMLDGSVEFTPCTAAELARILGSTEDFWIKRSSLYRVQQEAKKKFANLPRYEPDPIDRVLEKIISDCLSAQIKREDAPCSSEAHLNSAIAALYEMIPDYEPWDEESKAALQWAIDEGRILRGGLP
jgi:plasmid maintenance system antidote protein VapI